MPRRSYREIALDLAELKGVSVTVDTIYPYAVGVSGGLAHVSEDGEGSHSDVVRVGDPGVKSAPQVWKRVREILDDFVRCADGCICYPHNRK